MVQFQTGKFCLHKNTEKWRFILCAALLLFAFKCTKKLYSCVFFFLCKSGPHIYVFAYVLFMIMNICASAAAAQNKRKSILCRILTVSYVSCPSSFTGDVILLCFFRICGCTLYGQSWLTTSKQIIFCGLTCILVRGIPVIRRVELHPRLAPRTRAQCARLYQVK